MPAMLWYTIVQGLGRDCRMLVYLLPPTRSDRCRMPGKTFNWVETLACVVGLMEMLLSGRCASSASVGKNFHWDLLDPMELIIDTSATEF